MNMLHRSLQGWGPGLRTIFVVLFSTIGTIAMAQQTKFENAFQSYLDSSAEKVRSCKDQLCFDQINIPVVQIDAGGEAIYWNNAALSLNIPNRLTGVLYDRQEVYAVFLHQDHTYFFVPIYYEDKSHQRRFLKKSMGRSSEFATYHIDTLNTPINPTADSIVSQVVLNAGLGKGHVFFYFLSIALLFLIILRYSDLALESFGEVKGSAIVILLLTGIRLLYSLPQLTAPLSHHDIFRHQLDSAVFSASLSELFLNMLLFFVITIFLFKTFDNKPIRTHGKYSRWYFLLSGYLLVMTSIISFVYVVKRVVIHSAISFHFDKIYILDWNTHVFILSILFFISSLFFLSYLLIKTLSNTGATMGERLLIFSLATLITFPLFNYAELHVSPFGFYVLVLSILILMDLFVETKQKSVSWLVIWLVTIASGTTALLYSHNSIAYYQKGEVFAEQLSDAYLTASSLETAHTTNSENFQWAIYDAHTLVRKNGVLPFDVLQSENIPSLGSSTKILSDGSPTLLYRNAPGIVVVISKSQNTVVQFISLFSFLFTSLTLVVILVFLLNLYLNFLPQRWNFKIMRDHSIRRQIQYVIFSMLVISFATVFAVTSFYLRNHKSNSTDDILSSQQTGLQYLSEYLKRLPLPEINADVLSDWPKLGSTYYLFDAQGTPLSSNTIRRIVRAPYSLTNAYSEPIPSVISVENNIDEKSIFQRLLIQGQPYIIGITQNTISGEEQYFINNLLGTLLNLYIFLFIIASSIALAFSDNITRPLLKLREKFSSVKIGSNNERIDWQSKDEVGQLIREYNLMLEKIEDSVQTLAMTEREVAWREMAKQVAHEIKNPLTPMKLSLQHLQFAIKRNPDHAAELMDRAGSTLLEQIENLSKIASEFSNFAKMPQPENKKVILNDVASSVHDLFRKREDMDINLYIPIDEIYVFGDKHYMTRVLINLLKNAIQAIPNKRRGNIEIHVYKDEENAILKVSDNGTGIPKNIRNKVFQPNFTSKNSGTGLGLAICANIIESFNGKIYFETTENVGTTFFIEIPLMHMADNFKVEEHVIL